ncbi:hypothetical protein VIGAN_04240300, partial [Vigna angularis var. angularis]
VISVLLCWYPTLFSTPKPSIFPPILLLLVIMVVPPLMSRVYGRTFSFSSISFLSLSLLLFPFRYSVLFL